MPDEIVFLTSGSGLTTPANPLYPSYGDSGGGSASGSGSSANLTAMHDQCVMERPPAGTFLELFVYGLIYPFLVLVIIFTNVNGIVVLLRLQNFTQTNMLLLSIFIVDLLTTTIPFPKFFLQYTIGLNQPQIPHYPWCYLSSLLFPVLPIITNNISIWFVVTLTVQRFTCVWRREVYNRIFSQHNIVVIIVSITLGTTMFHSVLFIGNYRESLKCDDGQNAPYSICNEDWTTFIIPGNSDLELYVYMTYYLARIVVFHFIPILAIAVSNLLLIRILLRAEGTRRRLFTPKEMPGATLLTKQRDSDDRSRHSSVLTTATLTTTFIAGGQQQTGEPVGVNGHRKSFVQLAASAVTNGTAKIAAAKLATANGANRYQPRQSMISRGNGSVTATSTVDKDKDNSSKTQRISTTTHMLMAISTIYLVQHIFQSILFVYGVALNVMWLPEPEFLLRSITVQNLVYWAGFPANFLLCLHVQAPFREAFFLLYRDLSLVRRYCKFCLRPSGPKMRRLSMTTAGELSIRTTKYASGVSLESLQPLNKKQKNADEEAPADEDDDDAVTMKTAPKSVATSGSNNEDDNSRASDDSAVPPKAVISEDEVTGVNSDAPPNNDE